MGGFVWASVCKGWLGLGVVYRILDKVGALPKDGWRNWFFRSILLKIPIFPQGTKYALVFFCLLEGSIGKEKMELLIGLTSPYCCCSARSGQHGGCDECLISRNTSQIAKLYLPWIAKCILFCSVARKQLWTMGLFCPQLPVFQASYGSKQWFTLFFCWFMVISFTFQAEE